MKGIRFYADIPGTLNEEGVAYVPKRITVSKLCQWSQYGDDFTLCNCIAVLLGKEHRNYDYTQEALVSTFAWADSGVSLGSVSQDYLRKCRRIPEDVALRLHPQLAERLSRGA